MISDYINIQANRLSIKCQLLTYNINIDSVFQNMQIDILLLYSYLRWAWHICNKFHAINRNSLFSFRLDCS